MRPLILLLAPALIGAATDAAPVCPAKPTLLSGPPGTRFDLALTAEPMRMMVPPEKSAAPGTHATVLGLKIARAGTYRIALGTAAWLDVIKDGKFVAAAAHVHGPACSGIRKIVDFTLAPGSYTIQISGSADTRTGILVTPLP